MVERRGRGCPGSHLSARALRRGDRAVGFRAAVPVELPGVAHLADEVHVDVGDDDVVPVAAGFGDNLAAGVAEVALAVEFADAPGLFPPRAVDGADPVAVGGGVGGLRVRKESCSSCSSIDATTAAAKR